MPDALQQLIPSNTRQECAAIFKW